MLLPIYEKPHAPDERALWDRGAKLVRRGLEWPVPFLRPWLRRRGRALQRRVAWVRVQEVTLTDWAETAIYSTVTLPSPGRCRVWWLRMTLPVRRICWTIVGWWWRRPVFAAWWRRYVW